MEIKRQIIKVLPVVCYPPESDIYVYNKSAKVLHGEEFMTNGLPDFPVEKRVRETDGSYRSLFGPCCAHNGLVLANCNQNLYSGFRRMVAVRKPFKEGPNPDSYDQRLKFNQNQYFSDLSFYTHYAQQIAFYTNKYTQMDDEALEHHDDPHDKLALRIQSWLELCESGERYDILWLRKTMYKLKKDEIAKFGKVMRMIGDLGCPASLQGFIVFDYIKKAMAAEPLLFGGGRCEFIAKPTYTSLKHAFDHLHTPAGKFYFCYFSDDSCLSFRYKGEILRYNVDISKCDASHGPGIFEALLAMTPEPMKDCMQRLIDQCGTPVKIVSVSDPHQSVTLKFDSLRLFSGWTGTTVVNNLANITICRCIVAALAEIEANDVAKGDLCPVFTRHIEAAGYIVTGLEEAKRCKQMEDVQFLKCSPALDIADVYQPVLNLGVLLRSSGTCKGDLPGRKTQTIEERARQFQFSVLHGMYPNLTTPFLTNMRLAAGDVTSERSAQLIRKEMEYKADMTDSPPITITTYNFLKRYRLTGSQQADLFDFSRAEVGTGATTASDFVSVVLGLDYELSALSSFT